MKHPIPTKHFLFFAPLLIALLTAWPVPSAHAEAPPPSPEILLSPSSPSDTDQPVERPDFSGAEYREERHRMVRTQIKRRDVEDEAVLEAMRQVPRHKLVPSGAVKQAYNDHPLPIGHGQTISQPYIVGLMTELLQLEPGDKVLEIGTGSGYQAAVLAQLVRKVVTIEIIEPLAKRAAANLREMGYRNVLCLSGDGYFGYKEDAPYDAIIVTAAARHVPPPLLEQLKPGGRMVIPVGPAGWTQNLMLVTRNESGKIRTRNILPVRFVPLTRGSE